MFQWKYTKYIYVYVNKAATFYTFLKPVVFECIVIDYFSLNLTFEPIKVNTYTLQVFHT
jgi:hypothetical protein